VLTVRVKYILCEPYWGVQEHLDNKLQGVGEKRWQIPGYCEAWHSSAAFLSASISCFCLQLHPPNSERAGAEHVKGSMCLVDVPGP